MVSQASWNIIAVDRDQNVLKMQGEIAREVAESAGEAKESGKITPLLAAGLEQIIPKVFSSGQSQSMEFRPQLKTKALVTYTIDAHPLSSEGSVFAAAIVITDESWRSRAQAALETQLQERQNIINNIEDVVCTLNSEGLITQINRACRSILGYTEAEMTYRHIFDFVRPEDREKAVNHIEKTIRSHSNFNNILRPYLHKNGETIWMSWSGTFHSGDDTLYCTGRDQTEIIEARKQLELSEKRFRTFFYSNPKPVFIFNTQTDKIVSVNLRLRKIFGSNSDLVGSSASQLLGKPYEPAAEIEAEVIKSMGIAEMQVLRKSNGELMYADVTRQPILVSSESLMIVIIRDVTDLFVLSREKALTNTFSAALQAPGDLKVKMDSICTVAAQFVNCSSYELWILNLNDYEVNLLTHSPELEKPAFEASQIFAIAEIFENSANTGYQLQPKVNDSGYSLLLPIKYAGSMIGLLVLSTHSGHPALSRVNFLSPALTQLAQPLNRELNHSEMQTIFNLSEDFLITFDQAGLLKKTNRTFAKNFNYPDKTLKSQPFWELLTRETDFAGRLKPLFNGERFTLPQVTMYTSSGNQIRVSWKFTPVPNRNIYIGAGTDVTENLLLNEKLQESVLRFNAITAAITDGFFALNGKFEIIFWNDVAATTFKQPSEQVLGRNAAGVLKSHQLNPLMELCREANKTNQSQQRDYLFGSRWFRISVFGARNIYTVFFRDITTEKKYQEELRESNQRYELVTRATAEAIWDLDLRENKMLMSDAYRKLFNYPDIPLTAEVVTNHLHAGDKEQITTSLKNTIDNTNDTVWEAEYRLVTGSGEIAYVLNRAFIIRDEAGKPARMIGSIQDFTSRKRTAVLLEELNQKLQQRARELETSNRDLEEFAYFASHDLQQPLRMIEGLLDLLKKKYQDQLDDTGRQLIQYSVEAALKMKTLIQELLKYSRVGTEKKDFVKLDLNETIREVIRLYQSDLEETGGTIKAGPLPKLNVLPNQIAQLFQNLVGNALKYRSSDRAPKIEIAATEQDDHWQFSVADNGIGIREKDYKKIFGIFQRLHHANEYSGSGIGLSLCKKITDRHLGEIWVDSEPDRGSTFYFTVKKDL